MAKTMRVKNYSQIVRKAPRKVKAKGRVKIKCFGSTPYYGQSQNFYDTNTQPVTSQPFVGPSLQQRMYGWALASTPVTVTLDSTAFQGRIISVDGNGFEATVTTPLTSGLTAGSIVYVNFAQVNAVSA
ncbi:hypothetical protein OIN60_13840 [Paenibacillus sp. P96]|uniref:Capsid protein n=1 Tax=Paenibacillus zeirhizosphaerae TaxID=2987519 RepID=A0ABT9FT02_9BACL|nr:hypothetical protein [Paenibacillus sp. P96]MDP4097853.1 hypothetical protein [Paenibacillus sp. P96]